jgi:hypothetical protein
MINQYKRLDVFRCNQESHSRFKGRVSVYHVLKEKMCYPHGCMYFLWHCVLLEKGNRCVHRFNYVGKKCKGCTYYIEEKVHLQPNLILDEKRFEQFTEELELFETWIEAIQFKQLSIAGRIRTIKPWFEQFLLPGGRKQTKIRGYLLVFKTAFIGIDSFEDTFYIRISEKQMKMNRFLPKMKVEMICEIRMDRGRLIGYRPKQIEILKRGWGNPWTRDRAFVAVKTASLLKNQPEQCISCQYGALTDVFDQQGQEMSKFRNLYCLKGIKTPQECYIKIFKQMNHTYKKHNTDNKQQNIILH